jgi:hypothetical protein
MIPPSRRNGLDSAGLLIYYFPEAAKRRSPCGSVRGWPVPSSHFSPGLAATRRAKMRQTKPRTPKDDLYTARSVSNFDCHTLLAYTL